MNAPDDTFTHDGRVYDLTKVRIMLRPEKAFLLKTSELTWVLKFDTPQEHRVLNAKIRYPLIVTKWRGKWTVVDGLHRLERYRRRGILVVPVKEVTADMLRKAIVSIKDK